jgi:hypothetical protein
MQDFEIIDYTAVSGFERLIKDIEGVLVAKEDPSQFEYQGVIFVCSTVSSKFEYVKEFSGWDQLLVVEPKTPIRNSKMICSAVRLALTEIGKELAFIVGNGRNGSYEGFFINGFSFQSVFIAKTLFIPTDCMELKGLMQIYNSRCQQHNDKEPMVSVSVEYRIPKYPYLAGRNWSLMEFERQYYYISHALSLRVGFEKSLLSQFLNSQIDPFLSNSWTLELNPKLYPTSALLNMLQTSFKNVQNSTTYNLTCIYSYIPGGFETNEEFEDDKQHLRQYVDKRDIDSAIFSIFESSSLVNSTLEKILLSLRFKNLTVPKDSLLWKFALRLFDASSSKPHFLSFKIGLVTLCKVDYYL